MEGLKQDKRLKAQMCIWQVTQFPHAGWIRGNWTYCRNSVVSWKRVGAATTWRGGVGRVVVVKRTYSGEGLSAENSLVTFGVLVSSPNCPHQTQRNIVSMNERDLRGHLAAGVELQHKNTGLVTRLLLSF